MLRTGLAVIALGLLALFGYFFVMSSPQHTSTERAKQAAVQVSDTLKDQGVAGLVWAALAKSYGADGARFLHVYYNDGRTLIYGFLPNGATADSLAAVARLVPGVKDVDVQVLPRPAYLNPPVAGETAGPAAKHP
jgi:hypothetical protein